MSEYKENPFSIIFGKEPAVAVERTQILEELQSEFCAAKPSQQVALLTGVRGSGKSTLTAKLMKIFAEKNDWIVADLLVESDMLEDLLDKLTQEKKAKALLKEIKLSVSAFGISAEVESRHDASVKIQLDEVLEALTKHGKRVLIVVDDVASTASMKRFVHYIHSCLMKDYNVFLLMNGVYDNIENLQNQKTLTFLQRAPKTDLAPFSKQSVANIYSEVFAFPRTSIKEMAETTKGFAYAVQALGYLAWKRSSGKDRIKLDSILPAFDEMLANGIYDKLWMDLSEKNREILSIIAQDNTERVSSARLLEICSWSKAQLSNYKKELIKKGILLNQRGIFEFALPRFNEYVLGQEDFL